MLEAASPPPQLVVAGLQAWYGESHILHGVDFDVRRGEVVTLLGRNGAGKTTTLKSIMGIVGKRKGSAKFEGRETVGLASDRIARLGVAICPEERGIFASLSVRENLMLPPRIAATGGLDLDRIFTLFPNLRERLASGGGKLSGGEQQMLAIARALMMSPRLLVLDEPSFGLAPRVVESIFAIVERIRREEHVSVLLVEQNASLALELADHAYLIETGYVVASGSAKSLANDPQIRRSYLGY
jgi:branched-chain amino acid transport system ATP-binding protein